MIDIRDTYELRKFVSSSCDECTFAQYLGLIHDILCDQGTMMAIADLYAAAEQLPDGDRRNSVMTDLATICDHYGIEQDQLP
jgi:hypothetical protein